MEQKTLHISKDSQILATDSTGKHLGATLNVKSVSRFTCKKQPQSLGEMV